MRRLKQQGLVLTILGTAACGGDDGAACPTLAGNWTIASHCSEALVGMTVPVTQTACTVSTGGYYSGLTGPVDDDGTLRLSGTIAGTALICDGEAEGDQITQTCNGCNVKLTR